MALFVKKLKNFLSSTVAKARNPFTLGKLQEKIHPYLHHHSGFFNKNEVSIFVFDKEYSTSTSTLNLSFFKQSIKRTKGLRHPCVLSYISEFDTEKKLFFICEKCISLKFALEKLSKEKEDEKGSVSVRNMVFKLFGVSQITKGMIFLQKNSLFHFGLSISSIFVNKNGDFKLFDFAWCTRIIDGKVSPTAGDFFVKKYFDCFFSQQLPPEIRLRKWNIVLRHPNACDAYVFGIFLKDLFGSELRILQKLKSDELSNDNPMKRIDISEIEDSNIFGSEVFQVKKFFEEECNIEIGSKQMDLSNKKEKLEILLNNLNKFPIQFLKVKILNKLFHFLEFGYAGSISLIFEIIFKIGEIMNNSKSNSSLFEADDQVQVKRFLKNILKLLQKKEKKIYKIRIFQNLKIIIEMSSSKDQGFIDKVLFPITLNCLTDVDPLLRETVIKSLIFIVPKVKKAMHLVEKKLIKILYKLQADPKHGIRTNTVIAVGLLAKYWSEDVRKTFLIRFFQKSIKDPFVYSRIYTIKAIMNTKEYYDVLLISKFIIPMISPFVVSTFTELRESAFNALNEFFEQLKDYVNSGKLETEIDSVVKEQEKKKLKNSSYFSWATSFFIEKRGLPEKPVERISNNKNKKINKSSIMKEKGHNNINKERIGKLEKSYQPPKMNLNDSDDSDDKYDVMNLIESKENKRVEVDDYIQDSMNMLLGTPTAKKKSYDFKTKEKKKSDMFDSDDNDDEGGGGWDDNDIIKVKDDDIFGGFEELDTGKNKKNEKEDKDDIEMTWGGMDLMEHDIKKEENKKVDNHDDLFSDFQYTNNFDDQPKSNDLNDFFKGSSSIKNDNKKSKKKKKKNGFTNNEKNEMSSLVNDFFSDMKMKTQEEKDLEKIEDNWDDF